MPFQLTPNSLIDAKGDILVISSRAMEDVRKTFGLSKKEEYIASRIVNETLLMINEIVRKLPEYSLKQLENIAKTDDQILNVVNQILEELRTVKTASISSDNDPWRNEQYRLAIIRRYDELQLLGLEEYPRPHKLSVAYVDLSVVDTFTSNEDDHVVDIIDTRESNSEQRIFSVQEALSNGDHFLIRGDAGSGKTTLLQWVAVEAANNSFPDALESWKEHLPFFVRLRHFSESSLPSVGQLPSLLSSVFVGDAWANWAESHFATGKIILLVDGIDELPRAKRLGELTEWLADIKSLFPKIKIIITTRPVAINHEWGSELDFAFESFSLKRMSQSQVFRFIEFWHEAVQETLSSDEKNGEFLRLAPLLRRRVENDPKLLSLTSTPLMCAVVCALHMRCPGTLPVEKEELYDACCRLMIADRETAKGVDVRDYPKITVNRRYILLQKIAYWLLRNNKVETDSDAVIDRIRTQIKLFPGLKPSDAPEVLRFLLERTGILRAPAPGAIDFVHRSFQDFFASRQIIEEGDITVLVNHSDDDMWQEILVLAAAKMNRRDSDYLITSLIERGDKMPLRRGYLYLLAAACVNVAVEVSNVLYDSVQQKLQELMPPKNKESGDALVPSHDLAVPYLKWKPEISKDSAIACVYTLASIGSPDAYEVLKTFLADSRSEVHDELVANWDLMDRRTYAREVITQLIKKDRRLRLIRPESFTGLEDVENLRSLTVINPSCDEWDNLMLCASLEELTLNSIAQRDKMLQRANLGKLKSLRLKNTSFERCGLPVAPKCKLIEFDNVNDIRDLWILNSYRSLKTLIIKSCTRLEKLDPIGDLGSIQIVEIKNMERLDVQQLLAMKSLISLDCDNSFDPEVAKALSDKGVRVTNSEGSSN